MPPGSTGMKWPETSARSVQHPPRPHDGTLPSDSDNTCASRLAEAGYRLSTNDGYLLSLVPGWDACYVRFSKKSFARSRVTASIAPFDMYSFHQQLQRPLAVSVQRELRCLIVKCRVEAVGFLPCKRWGRKRSRLRFADLRMYMEGDAGGRRL